MKMALDKFLSLCGTILGFIAVVLISKVLLASPDQVLRETYHYSPMGWPSVAIISNRAAQKADTLSSVILVSLAFALQFCSLFIKTDRHFTSGWLKAVIIAISLVGILTVTAYQIGSGAKKSYEMEIKMLAARNYVKSAIEGCCPLYSDVQAVANQYFGLRMEDKENSSDFVKRFATYLGYELPEKIDFSKFR
jgi:uncharacterized membrane protein